MLQKHLFVRSVLERRVNPSDDDFAIASLCKLRKHLQPLQAHLPAYAVDVVIHVFLRRKQQHLFRRKKAQILRQRLCFDVRRRQYQNRAVQLFLHSKKEVRALCPHPCNYIDWRNVIIDTADQLFKFAVIVKYRFKRHPLTSRLRFLRA